MHKTTPIIPQFDLNYLYMSNYLTVGEIVGTDINRRMRNREHSQLEKGLQNVPLFLFGLIAWTVSCFWTLFCTFYVGLGTWASYEVHLVYSYVYGKSEWEVLLGGYTGDYTFPYSSQECMDRSYCRNHDKDAMESAHPLVIILCVCNAVFVLMVVSSLVLFYGADQDNAKKCNRRLSPKSKNEINGTAKLKNVVMIWTPIIVGVAIVLFILAIFVLSASSKLATTNDVEHYFLHESYIYSATAIKQTGSARIATGFLFPLNISLVMVTCVSALGYWSSKRFSRDSHTIPETTHGSQRVHIQRFSYHGPYVKDVGPQGEGKLKAKHKNVYEGEFRDGFFVRGKRVSHKTGIMYDGVWDTLFLCQGTKTLTSSNGTETSTGSFVVYSGVREFPLRMFLCNPQDHAGYDDFTDWLVEQDLEYILHTAETGIDAIQTLRSEFTLTVNSDPSWSHIMSIFDTKNVSCLPIVSKLKRRGIKCNIIIYQNIQPTFSLLDGVLRFSWEEEMLTEELQTDIDCTGTLSPSNDIGTNTTDDTGNLIPCATDVETGANNDTVLTSPTMRIGHRDCISGLGCYREWEELCGVTPESCGIEIHVSEEITRKYPTSFIDEVRESVERALCMKVVDELSPCEIILHREPVIVNKWWYAAKMFSRKAWIALPLLLALYVLLLILSITVDTLFLFAVLLEIFVLLIMMCILLRNAIRYSEDVQRFGIYANMFCRIFVITNERVYVFSVKDPRRALETTMVSYFYHFDVQDYKSNEDVIVIKMKNRIPMQFGPLDDIDHVISFLKDAHERVKPKARRSYVSYRM